MYVCQTGMGGGKNLGATIYMCIGTLYKIRFLCISNSKFDVALSIYYRIFKWKKYYQKFNPNCVFWKINKLDIGT